MQELNCFVHNKDVIDGMGLINTQTNCGTVILENYSLTVFGVS